MGRLNNPPARAYADDTYTSVNAAKELGIFNWRDTRGLRQEPPADSKFIVVTTRESILNARAAGDARRDEMAEKARLTQPT